MSELSWQSDSNWESKNWYSWFEEASRSDRTFEITYVDNFWSLRQNQPKLEYFAELLPQKGTQKFTLVYAQQQENGYVFEIEPGRNCYIPPDRLVTDENNLEFFLPNTDICTGDKLIMSGLRLKALSKVCWRY